MIRRDVLSGRLYILALSAYTRGNLLFRNRDV